MREVHNNKNPHPGRFRILWLFHKCFFYSLVLEAENGKYFIFRHSIINNFHGIKDDLIGLSVKLKPLVEVISASIFIFLTEIRIDSFYGLFGVNELPVMLSYGFTIFVFIMIINLYLILQMVLT